MEAGGEEVVADEEENHVERSDYPCPWTLMSDLRESSDLGK